MQFQEPLVQGLQSMARCLRLRTTGWAHTIIIVCYCTPDFNMESQHAIAIQIGRNSDQISARMQRSANLNRMQAHQCELESKAQCWCLCKCTLMLTKLIKVSCVLMQGL